MAAAIIGFDLAGQVGKAGDRGYCSLRRRLWSFRPGWPRRLGLHGQIDELSLDAIARNFWVGALPVRHKILHLPAWRKIGEHLALRRRDRQAFDKIRQRL